MLGQSFPRLQRTGIDVLQNEWEKEEEGYAGAAACYITVYVVSGFGSRHIRDFSPSS